MTEIKITEKKESPLLSRTEITAEMAYSGVTPKKEELKSKLASALSAKENLLVVREIHTKYGEKKAVISFYIYNNEKDMQEIEPKKKEKKKKSKAEKPEKEAEEKKTGEKEEKKESKEETKEEKPEAKEEAKKEKKEESKEEVKEESKEESK